MAPAWFAPLAVLSHEAACRLARIRTEVAITVLRAAVVAFTPGTRTAWHAHPVGQTLDCLPGIRRVQFEAGTVQALFPGDIVAIPPNTSHRHGAARRATRGADAVDGEGWRRFPDRDPVRNVTSPAGGVWRERSIQENGRP